MAHPPRPPLNAPSSRSSWTRARRAARRARGPAAAPRAGVRRGDPALVATIGVALMWFFAARERDIAASRDLATKSASLIASDPALGKAVALEALRRHDTAQAENAVRQAAYVTAAPRPAGARWGSTTSPSAATGGW